MEDKKEIAYEGFIEFQRLLHEKNQKKIRVGLKVNILLPLVFLVISFISNGSKLVFLILWIVSLFGISFYLLYIEFTDFKMQHKMREFGLVTEDENKALIGSEVSEKIDELKSLADDIKELKNLEVFNDIKELKANILEDKSSDVLGIEEKDDLQTDENKKEGADDEQ